MDYKGNNKDFKIGSGNNIPSGIAYTKEDSTHDHYPEFEKAVKEKFNRIVQSGGKLFTTNASDIYLTFLRNLPAHSRQHYTCNACRTFFERFGGLVTINEDGVIESVMWDLASTPGFFRPAVRALNTLVTSSRVNGVFLGDTINLGTPVTGEWTHVHVQLPREMVYRNALLTADQKMAELKEDYRMLSRALADYSLSTINTAVSLLQGEALYRSEKVLGVAEWFQKLTNKRLTTRNARHRENMTWLAVSTAPVGFCHVRSSMIGTLLDDIKSGLTYNEVKRKFDMKMDATKYQRPQAPAKAGNIARGEEIMRKLGLTGEDLQRRFARLNEIPTIWKPTPKMEERYGATGVFGHLKPKGANQRPESTMELPAKNMTWDKFLRTVLPNAEKIEYYVESGNAGYSALVTALYDDSKPIIKWDTEEQRNPFSHYVYNNGSRPNSWNLTHGYTEVTGVTYQPSMWNGDYPNHGKSVFFILDGAKDKNFASKFTSSGNALFPENLKSELHEIRATIEQYSKGETIHGYEEASACGIRLQNGQTWNAKFRVTTSTGKAVYTLDRWD